MSARFRRHAVVGLIGLVIVGASPLMAQEGLRGDTEGRPLSLTEALGIAAGQSEDVVIARAEAEQAESDVARARAARLPQLSASASYSRALASEFEDLSGSPEGPEPPPHCLSPFTPDPQQPTSERLRAIELELTCPPALGFGGIDFGEIGFGSENTYNLGLSFSLPLFTGGRLAAQSRIATSAREVADVRVSSVEAQLQYDVTAAYFDAQLSDRLLAIAAATYDRLEEVLLLTELGARTGTQPEFDMLRARVALQNHRPVLIQREAQRDLAHDRLRLFLNLPLETPLTLTTRLEEVSPANVELSSEQPRAPVRQAAATLQGQESQVDVARAQRLPSVSLFSQYGQVAYSGLVPTFGDFRDNWNVGASLQVPIFSGGRVSADVLAAEAGVVRARAQLRQAEEMAILDTRTAIGQLDAARAMWEASLGTVEQAEQAYTIAEVRYREGISSQLELTDSRIMLEQALANRATAARDLRVAETRVELLPFLPIGTPTGMSPDVPWPSSPTRSSLEVGPETSGAGPAPTSVPPTVPRPGGGTF